MKLDIAKKIKKLFMNQSSLNKTTETFDFESPWEGTNYIKEIKNFNKDGKKN
jgi:hypothetical protein